jgi:protein-S-isoprenylcysteine O-methyltransferase Ste14
MRPKWWVAISIVVAGISLFSLHYIINNLWPSSQTIFAKPQLLFLTFLFLGLSAGAVPVAAFFNQRFASDDWYKRDKTRLVREGAWVGLFGVILLYLQLLRALNWTIVLVLAGVFILIEIFFLTRD